MRSIKGNLTESLSSRMGNSSVGAMNAAPVGSFRELVSAVAELSYLNKDYLLFYRGQARDYLNKAGSSTFYPGIYRGERLPREQVELAFDVLESASTRLCDALEGANVDGYKDVRRRKYIQWSILQHYEVCATPLLDFTHSLLVACSFACLDEIHADPHVFVFGLPYVTNRVSVNSEHDIVNIRLLSICPPEALRPYFQEGYLAGTDEVTAQYDSKSELDFNNRLIAKFRFESGPGFWAGGFRALPREVLYPPDDRVERICGRLRQEMSVGVNPGRVGAFLKEWNELEAFLTSRARREGSDRRVHSALDASMLLADEYSLPDELVREIDDLRRLRNNVVHRPELIRPEELLLGTKETREVLERVHRWSVDAGLSNKRINLTTRR